MNNRGGAFYMAIDSATIKGMILEEGIDLVGIADARDIVLAKPPRPATNLMPTARSVIVMAVAHSMGAVCAPDIKLWTRNKMQTSRLLDQVAEKMGRFLERSGYLTLPVSADKPVEIQKLDPETGKKLDHTKTIAHLSLKHAAESTGMGKIGRSNLLLTEKFGPHQRLGGIITEAVLEPDKRSASDLCPTGCRKCEAACPVGALKDGKYNVDPCFNYWTWGFDRVPPKRLRDFPSYIGMLLRHNRQRNFIIEVGQTMITDVDNCFACMKACPVGTEWKEIRPGNSRD
jgi:epoxyqueuosine reductase